MSYSDSFPNGTRFNGTVACTWYPPYNMYGAVGCDYGEVIILYDDDPDGVYDDPNFDGWAFITKRENGMTGFFPEAYITGIRAIDPSKIANKPNPQKPNQPPQKKTNGHPGGKPVNLDKHAPAGKAGGMLGKVFPCMAPKTGKAAKAKALDNAVDNDDVDTDDDDDGPEPVLQGHEPYQP